LHDLIALIVNRSFKTNSRTCRYKLVVCNLKLTDTYAYLPCVVENERGCKFITDISKVKGSLRVFIEDEYFVIKHKLLNAVSVMIHSVVHYKSLETHGQYI